MELLLIVTGGVLTTAIIFMVIDGLRGGLSDEDEDGFE